VKLAYRTYPEGQDVHEVGVPLVHVIQGNTQLTQVLLAVTKYAPAKHAVQVVGALIAQ
jgi:hypothetical protein